MAETALINITDIQTIRRIDPKIAADKVAVFCNDIQRKNLRGLLGDALYYAFMADSRAAGIYKELLDGKSYEYDGNTIQYYGLKPALIYWWLALATREGELFLSDHGAVQFVDNPQQNFESAKSKEQIAVSYMETAQGYANDVIKYLNTNAATYPLWKGDTEKNKTNFISFRV